MFEKLKSPAESTIQLRLLYGSVRYVILSRIVKISQLYLKPFDPKKIYCSEAAKEEANKIKMNSLAKLKYKWDDEDSIKVTSLNIRSLNKHSDDLENDFYVNKHKA